ncbi:MAG: hypothetical protein MUE44_21750 [Oscillatoriaceae cyanobacterium Prado104]|jgi:hypothetical protein|nr:hypothetical protein [Oscillatoriaceae cyanobacterium Prado104]
MTEEFASEKNTSEEIAPAENISKEVAPEEEITLAAIRKRDSNNKSERDIVCISVTGPISAVKTTIFTLYQLGFAEVNDWSPIQRAADPKQAISVLIRRQRVQEEQQKHSKQQAKKSPAIE